MPLRECKFKSCMCGIWLCQRVDHLHICLADCAQNPILRAGSIPNEATQIGGFVAFWIHLELASTRVALLDLGCASLKLLYSSNLTIDPRTLSVWTYPSKFFQFSSEHVHSSPRCRVQDAGWTDHTWLAVPSQVTRSSDYHHSRCKSRNP